MKHHIRTGVAALLAAVSLVTVSGCGSQAGNQSDTPAAAAGLVPKVSQEQGKTVKTFELVARKTNWKLNDQTEVEAWTYNGTVPGSQIRVKQGEIVRVILKNELDEPTSIHWHGYPVPNTMDGVPGVTQNAVRPGESYTYEFVASVPGTYWYHSHQDSAVQEDRGLYGTLVVEGADEPPVDREYTLVLDEWNPMMGAMDHSGMSMDHSGMSMNHSGMPMHHGDGNAVPPANPDLPPGARHDAMMKAMYTVFSVNGKSGDAIQPLKAAKGQRVRLRFVNAGMQSHVLDLNGQPYTIIATDGQRIASPQTIQGRPFVIAPGERYDIEFTATDSSFAITSRDDSPAADQMRIPVAVIDGKPAQSTAAAKKPLDPVDLTGYGTPGQTAFRLDGKYDMEYRMTLGEVADAKTGDALFTINGQTAPQVPPIRVKKGDKVKVTLVNEGTSNHPMHLHGHFFQILSKNGKPVSGAPIVKDTLNLKPRESYVVAFVADNSGDWMFHCHDLHHAAAGMATSVMYDGHKPFAVDPSVDNKGE